MALQRSMHLSSVRPLATAHTRFRGGLHPSSLPRGTWRRPCKATAMVSQSTPSEPDSPSSLASPSLCPALSAELSAELHPLIVEDVAVALRRELAVVVPTLLLPVLDELNKLNATVRSVTLVGAEGPCSKLVTCVGEGEAAVDCLQQGPCCADQNHCLPVGLREQEDDTIPSSECVQVHHPLPSRMVRMMRDSPQGDDPAAPLMQCDDEDVDATDPVAAKRLSSELSDLTSHRSSLLQDLEDLNLHWQNRRQPFEQSLAALDVEMQQKREQLEQARLPCLQLGMAPGPQWLSFVSGDTFGAICNVVVLLNLATMIWRGSHSLSRGARAIDNIFLLWYILELAFRASYYQGTLLCGSPLVVWWNWLDVGIVVGGVIDQWLVPALVALSGGPSRFDVASLRALRILRLFRLMRFLKIVKAFIMSDLKWSERPAFKMFMASVVAVNSLVMTLELDVPWMGWVYVEHALLMIYCFELAVRLKLQGCFFFRDPANIVWNNLDFVMVVGGMLDLWLMPLLHFLDEDLLPSAKGLKDEHAWSGPLRLLKLMRILRVLRLVRVLKMVKPLYRLVYGVIESVRAMQWVLVLTLLTLYACAIIFTDVVGKALLRDGKVGKEAEKYFGTVARSLFSLFKLMNGDMSVVKPITMHLAGKLLFVTFMVVSNWAILAILTSVVSDHMMSTSHQAAEEDNRIEKRKQKKDRIRRLAILFKEIDTDGDGSISRTEWQQMLRDAGLCHELCEMTELDGEDLETYFRCLSKDERQFAMEQAECHSQAFLNRKRLDYTTFMETLKDGAQANPKSILHLQSQLHILEARMLTNMDENNRLEAVRRTPRH